ncbi:MAG: hypothetical protein OXD37_10360 [Acidimicrobiaceae bacterium]|nr:hypothetical protein [Acidimicrobiaceae bacterium]
MPDEAGRLLEIGRVGRPHGTRGEVTVTLVSNRPERLREGSEFQTEGGVLVVASSRPHKHRHLVRFVGVEDRGDAEVLRGAVLRAAPISDPDELWVHELIGARLSELAGADRGRVVAVVANPAGDLLELEDGTLVPLRFVVSSAPGERVTVEVPDGLFEADEPR